MLEMLSVPFNNVRTHTDHHNIVGLSSQLECLGPVSQYLVISHNNSEVSTTALQKPASIHPNMTKIKMKKKAMMVFRLSLNQTVVEIST